MCDSKGVKSAFHYVTLHVFTPLDSIVIYNPWKINTPNFEYIYLLFFIPLNS